MALSRTKAELRGFIKHNGREYVSQSVCAKRLGIAVSSLCEATQKGNYTRMEIPDHKGLWYDWHLTRAAFNRLRMKQDHVQGGRRQKKDAAVFNGKTVSDLPVPNVPPVGNAEVADVEIPKEEPDIMSYFDPEDPNNADCWETDVNGHFLMIPNTDPPRHYVDWKKAQDQGRAHIYYQQYMKQKGDLIQKQDVIQILTRIFPPVTAVIMQMPDKYASRINGRVEEMIGRPMTNEEITVIRAILSDEAERICHNLQDAVEKATEDGE